jgi:hypothetical protein
VRSRRPPSRHRLAKPGRRSHLLPACLVVAGSEGVLESLPLLTGPPPHDPAHAQAEPSAIPTTMRGLVKKCVNEIRRRPSCCPAFPCPVDVRHALGDFP